VRIIFISITFILLFYGAGISHGVDTAWVRIYDSPEHSRDIGNTVIVDSLDRIYVGGLSDDPSRAQDVIVYDTSGNTVWSRVYGCTAPLWYGSNSIALGGLGDVFSIGPEFCHGTFNFGTTRYSNTGDSIWTRLYPNSPSGYGQARTLAADNDGNVYVLGIRVDPENPCLWATVKYDRSGNRRWVAIYLGERAETPGTPFKIALDESSNVIVTGEVAGINGIDGFATVKYDSSGAEVWSNICNNGVLYGEGRKLAVDRDGNIFVIAYNSGYQVLIKYNPDGSFGWEKHLWANGGLIGMGVTVDTLGNIYTIGMASDSPLILYYNMVTAKYTPNGDIYWQREYDGPIGRSDIPFDIIVGGSGAVYVGGTSASTATNRDYCALKYTSGGELLWAGRYNRTGNGFENVFSIALDDQENVYVTGASQGISGARDDYDIATVKFVENPNDAVEDVSNLPDANILLEAYPNPFNTQTCISYRMAVEGSVKITIFNITGQKMATLLDKKEPAGPHQVVWDASSFPSGLYIARKEIGTNFQSIKMVLLK
jgi:hypothetical protein